MRQLPDLLNGYAVGLDFVHEVALSEGALDARDEAGTVPHGSIGRGALEVVVAEWL